MVDGVLYLLVRNVENSQLAWSTDRGASWTFADWKFTASFGAPTFVNFGRNYEGARDDFVYIVSHDADSAYEIADGYRARASPQSNGSATKDAWQFFAGMTRSEPIWTRDIARRKLILRNDGICYRASVSYNAGLDRYLLVHPVPTKSAGTTPTSPTRASPAGWQFTTRRNHGAHGRLRFSHQHWDVGPGETCSFPTKWMSADGRTLHLVFSGDDCFRCARLN